MLTQNLYIAQTSNYNYYIIDVVKGTEKPTNWYLTFDGTVASRELIMTDFDGQGLARFILSAGNKNSSYIAQNPMYLATINNQPSTANEGRHDACVAVRAVPVVEAMAALVLQDLLLQ